MGNVCNGSFQRLKLGGYHSGAAPFLRAYIQPLQLCPIWTCNNVHFGFATMSKFTLQLWVILFYNKQKGCIFTGRKGKPITCNGVYRMMQKIADMTGVPLEKAHPHSLRHLFALTYIDTYNNIGELADILGHSSLEITRIYLSSSREEKRNKMNRLNL